MARHQKKNVLVPLVCSFQQRVGERKDRAWQCLERGEPEPSSDKICCSLDTDTYRLFTNYRGVNVNCLTF